MSVPERKRQAPAPAEPQSLQLATIEFATAWALKHTIAPHIEGAELVVEKVDLDVIGGFLAPSGRDNFWRWIPDSTDTLAVMAGCVDQYWEPVYYWVLRRFGAIYHLCVTRQERREYLAVVHWDDMFESAKQYFRTRPFVQDEDPPWLKGPAR